LYSQRFESILEGEHYYVYQTNESGFAKNLLSLKTLGTAQMHLQQIEVSSSQAAQQVIDQLNQGVSFSKVETVYDVSGSFYRMQGGDLGWITVGGSGYPLEWSAQVSSLKAGQIGTPFQIDGRYYIVKCLEGPDYEPWPFSKVQDQARQNLIAQQLNDALAHILFQKEKIMHITILDRVYSALMPQFETVLKN
jgi:parvulin-like peptidyl-prolyl isomerase